MNGNSGPAFFKIMHKMSHLVSALHIPPSFVEKYGEYLSSKVQLEIDQSGKSWNVKIEGKNDGRYWLTRGWVKFVEENNIKPLDLVTFQFVAGSRILVQIFDKNGYKRGALTHTSAQKKTSTKHQTEMRTSSSSEEGWNISPFDGESDSESNSSEDFFPTDVRTNKKISFKLTWKSFMNKRLLIRLNICKELGLTKERTLKLKNIAGDIFEVSIYKTRDNRVGMGEGWPAFTKASNFVLGKVYKFKFIRNSKGELVLQTKTA